MKIITLAWNTCEIWVAKLGKIKKMAKTTIRPDARVSITGSRYEVVLGIIQKDTAGATTYLKIKRI